MPEGAGRAWRPDASVPEGAGAAVAGAASVRLGALVGWTISFRSAMTGAAGVSGRPVAGAADTSVRFMAGGRGSFGMIN